MRNGSRVMRKFLAFCICLAALLMACSFSAAAAIQEGDIVTFGSYPQSRVTDTALIRNLNSVSKAWKPYPYYEKEVLNKNLMSYADLTYQSVRYRAVKINQYRPYDSRLASSQSNSEQSQNGYSEGQTYYFLYEPIEWVVLDASNRNAALVMAYNHIEAQPFTEQTTMNGSAVVSTRNPSKYPNNWAYCTLRDFLNGYTLYSSDYGTFNFINAAFNTGEQGIIAKSTLQSPAPLDISLTGDTISDKIFILSKAEIETYGNHIKTGAETGYARANGRRMIQKYYLTRTPASNTANLYYASGKTLAYSSSDFNGVQKVRTGVRPAMRINLDSAYVKGESYTLTYHANGGTGEPAAQEGSGTITLSATKPTKNGYTFMGWAATSNATSAQYQAGGTYVLSKDTTLYAVWEQSTYTLTYDANGGTGAPGAQSSKNTVTIPTTSPTRSGYSFFGWGVSRTATRAAHFPGDTITLTGNITLYAVWSRNPFVITYDANGGKGAPPLPQSGSGYVQLAPTEPTRDGYIFKGWATTSNATTAEYQAGGYCTVTGNMTLYAVWEAIPKLPENSSGGQQQNQQQQQNPQQQPEGAQSKPQAGTPGNPSTGTMNSSKPVGSKVKDPSTGATYVVTKQGELQYRTAGGGSKTAVTIPEYVKIGGISYRITSIAPKAFYKQTKLKRVKIGKNIVTIGDQAFYGCKNLTSVTIPASVAKIGKQAFMNCKKVKKITILSTRLTSKSVGTKAFAKGYGKVTVKVPAKKLRTYKKLLKSRGVSGRAVIRK